MLSTFLKSKIKFIEREKKGKQSKIGLQDAADEQDPLKEKL